MESCPSLAVSRSPLQIGTIMKETSPVVMDAGRWQQISDAFFSVMDVDPERRGRFLAELCSGDPALLDEVNSLVAAHQQAGDFIQMPVRAPDVPPVEDTATELMEGRKFGPFRVVREIAHGGMGAVYLAEREDGEYRQQVAVKIVRRGLDSASNLRRFRSERQILAKLEHPYIARLLDGGTSSDGLPYLVMEYVDGQPIDQYCDERRLSIRERLHLFLKVCSAVQYAHEHHVIHRDLKPNNILITAQGEPRLLDFGIAKLLGWDSSLQSYGCATTTWWGPMTPDYASPEQVCGKTVSKATDIYSLGTLLYELLSGHRPYRTEGCLPHVALRAICEVEPEKPSFRIHRIDRTAGSAKDSIALMPERIAELRSERPERLPRLLTGDLDNIVLMAMRKEPQARYPSVAHLATDIREHLQGRPVVACKATWTYRVGKFLSRKRSWTMAVAVAALVLMAAIVLTQWQTHVATRQLRQGLLKQLSKILEAHDSARGLVVNTSELIFDPGHVTLQADARERLAKIAGVLAVYPSLRLQVEGHTDNGGDDALNLQVSKDRAKAVKEYLVQQAIPEKMITAEGFGGSRPIATNDNDAGRQRNRRVEIIISGGLIDSQTQGPAPANGPNLVLASANTKMTAARNLAGTSGNPNLALGKPAKGSPACNSSEGPEKAFNGSISGGHADKWCSHASPAFLQVDLGARFSLRQFIVRHAGAGGDELVLNTHDFTIQVSDDGTKFTTVAAVNGNTQSVTTHILNLPVTARFVRLNITNPSKGGDNSSRIYELEVYSFAQPEIVPE